MKIAIIGATGLVGNIMLKVLKEQDLANNDLLLVASERSLGKKISFNNKKYTIISITEAIKLKPEIAIFSAGSETSLKYAPEFAKNGTTVIDNSSAWRMDKSKKLIIPEINANILTKDDKIIANPNCSTIQLLLAIAPLHNKYTIKRLIISTYQSITGSGIKAVKQLENERKNISGEKAYPYMIDKNCLPHCDEFLENDYTKEEMKLVNETHKILDNKIKTTATAVRVPVSGGHSESVNLELKKEFNVSDIRNILNNSSGIIVQDKPSKNIYPMPITSEGKDEVFVGRIRRDYSIENGLNMFIVADNLRKGAATNTIQIAKYLIENNLL
ncbi:MAG: aspartate-semialdehyde dehydrogenase [Bacteroidales bacterium]|jgi:aspartate-semialdehyde dehydrogenase|nr:aspartate-semialdehyde dehydrogenase [Bacteroidales bacterium]